MISKDLEEKVSALEQRLEAVEDELAIHRLIVRYGLAVDTGNGDEAAAVFTSGGVYDVDVGRMEGQAAVRAMVEGERHQSMVGHCAHQIGPAVVERVDAALGDEQRGHAKTSMSGEQAVGRL